MTRIRILLAAGMASMAFTRVAAQRPDVEPVRVGVVAEKLGVKLVPAAPRELELGHSATTTLDDPKKIAPYGIKNMHEGARVTITCIGPNAIRVEADEMEPVPQKTVVILKLAPDGSLTKVELPTPPKPPKG